jgi:hypothetical protein
MNVEQQEDLAGRSAYATLERAYIAEYLRGLGYTPERLRELPVAQARTIMGKASRYASMKLSEVESRSHLIEEMHGGPHPI